MVYLPKSPIAHPCLATEKAKANGNYNCGQVLETLKNDFKNKCYICETKEPHSINIEHFKAHRGDNDLKFDWQNLFYCCGHCNNTKLAKAAFEDILNCTIELDGVDTKIKYTIKPLPKEKAEITALENTDRVNNTVRLLDEAYNGTTTLKLIESANIRSKLLSEIRAFYDLLLEYDNDLYDENEKLQIKNKIIRELRPASNFTAFKRWIIRDSDYFRPQFAEYL